MCNPIMPFGTYLRKRRESSGTSLADIYSRAAGEPHLARYIHPLELAAIERGERLPNFATIVILRGCFSFDVTVLECLVGIAFGAPYPTPRLCQQCGCSEGDACCDAAGETCAWAGPALCSACADKDPAGVSSAPIAGNDAGMIEAGAVA